MDTGVLLGLCLTWMRTRGSTSITCLIFGVTPTVMSLFIRFGRDILIKVLKDDVYTQIRVPTPTEVPEFQEVIAAKPSLLTSVYGVMDGLKIRVEKPGDECTQRNFYNGWCMDTLSSALGFTPDGVIFVCALNAPGAMHDSKVADFGGIMDKLTEIYEKTGDMVAVDDAFCRKAYPFCIQSRQSYDLAVDAIDIVRQNQATSLRQSGEWGTRSFQGSFPRVNDPLRFEENGERKLILRLYVYMSILRTRFVKLNQTQNVYVGSLQRDAS